MNHFRHLADGTSVSELSSAVTAQGSLWLPNQEWSVVHRVQCSAARHEREGGGGGGGPAQGDKKKKKNGRQMKPIKFASLLPIMGNDGTASRHPVWFYVLPSSPSPTLHISLSLSFSSVCLSFCLCASLSV